MRRPTDLDWPCHNVVPGMAPVAAILARTEETVVAVTGIRAYPTGFGFTLTLRLRNLHPRERRGFWPFPEFGYHGRRTVPADAFRFTIEFADGRSVTNLDPAPSDPEVPAFEQPMLSSGPGTGLTGSGSSWDRWGWDMEYRVRPLPPPGPLAIVCVWPERGIPRRASRSTARPSSGRPRPRCACGSTTRTVPPTDAFRQSEEAIVEGNRYFPMSWLGESFAGEERDRKSERIPSPKENP